MASTKRSPIQRTSIFSLEDQFTFYASYHNNRVNKTIHLVCIWPILWTALALMTMWSFGTLPACVLQYLPIKDEAWNLHLGTPVVLLYMVVYCVMDPLAGGLASLMVLSCYLTSNLWMADGGSAVLAGAVNIMGWLAQFYGHGAHEGRVPALVDNIFQAFLAAPLFVLCEVLFEVGYKPNMYKRIRAKALLNVQEFKTAKRRSAEKDE